MTIDTLRFLLLALLALPLAAAVGVALLGPRRGNIIRWVSLATVSVVLLLAGVLAVQLSGMVRDRAEKPGTVAPTFRPEMVPGAPGVKKDVEGKVAGADPHGTAWDLLPLGPGSVQFYVGLDGLNVWLVVLTALLLVPAVLVSWTSIRERVNEYYAWLLTLETGMIGVFLAFDIVLFYVFFELTLVPLFFLIGIWGGPERRHAARKFFIYTLAGSVITLLGLLGIVLACYDKSGELTFSIPRLIEIVHNRLAVADERSFWTAVQFWVFLAMAAGFSVKVPLVPLHTWLPLAHVEAPTAGSVLLAGVLLKIGAYGFLRLCLPLAPDASLTIGVPLIGTLAVVGIIYGAFCALAQTDIKKLVAYSSVSHLGFCMLGMFALNAAGLAGSLLQMVNHGLSTGALFLLVGMLYDRYHTRKISDYGGLAARLHGLAFFMVFISLSSIGLPGLNGFVGEVLVLMGMFNLQGTHVHGPTLAALAATGIILGAWYSLTLLLRVFFGPVKEPAITPLHEGHGSVADLNLREVAALAPIALLCLLLGVYPQPFFETAKRDIGVVVRIAEEARQRAGSVGPAPTATAHIPDEVTR